MGNGLYAKSHSNEKSWLRHCLVPQQFLHFLGVVSPKHCHIHREALEPAKDVPWYFPYVSEGWLPLPILSATILSRSSSAMLTKSPQTIFLTSFAGTAGTKINGDDSSLLPWLPSSDAGGGGAEHVQPYLPHLLWIREDPKSTPM